MFKKKHIYYIATLSLGIFIILVTWKETSKSYLESNPKTSTLIGSAQNTSKNYEIRKQNASSAFIHLIHRENDSINRVELFKCLEIFLLLNDWDELRKSSNEVLKKSIEDKNSAHIALSYRYLGIYQMFQNKNDSAYFYFSKELQINIKHNVTINIAGTYLYITELQYYISDHLGAQASALSALKSARRNSNRVAELQSLMWMGILSNELKEYGEAHRYYLEAIDLASKFSDENYFRNNLPKIYTSIGYNYFAQKKYKLSIDFYHKSLDQYQLLDGEAKSRLLDYLANSKFELRDYSKLPELWMEANKVRDSFKVEVGKNYNKLSLSKYYLIKGDTSKALKFAKEALLLSRSYKCPGDVKTMLKNIAEIDHKNSPKYIEEYIKLSDSLQLAERKMRNKFARIAYETDEIAAEKDVAIKEKRIVLSVSAGILLICSLLLTIKIQKTRQKELLFIKEQLRNDETIYNLIHESQLKVDKGRSSEKRRIAADLQNGIIAKLSDTRSNLQILGGSSDNQTIESCLGFINEIQTVEKEIRHIAHNLDREIFSGSTSFQEILESLFKESEEVSLFIIHREIDASVQWDTVSTLMKMNIYRILQEVLLVFEKTPLIKNVFINIERNQRGIQIFVNNDVNQISETSFEVKEFKNIMTRAKLFSADFKINLFKEKGSGIYITFQV